MLEEFLDDFFNETITMVQYSDDQILFTEGYKKMFGDPNFYKK